jgi:MFS family permease
MPADPPLFTRSFTIICLATLFFYLSFYLILPVMPLYVAAMGGTSFQIGLIIGFFAFVAMILRPPAGWIIDTRGCRLVLFVGMSVFLLASLGYTVANSVTTVLILRLFHGIGMGLFPTAATVVVAEVAPPARRGEAMGWFGIANSIGLIAGPASGTALAGWLGYPMLFLVAAGMAALGLLCILILPEMGQALAKSARLPRPQDLYSRPALLPSAIVLFLYLPYGVMVAFIPIIAVNRGLENAGTYYTAFALAMLAIRAKAGTVSDRRGRAVVVIPGLLITGLAFAVLGLTSGWIWVLVGAVIFGLGFGSAQPALMALTADRVRIEDRGKAMGTFYVAWELGIMSGSTGAGLLLGIMDSSFLLLACSIFPAIGALLALKTRTPSVPRPPS